MTEKSIYRQLWEALEKSRALRTEAMKGVQESLDLLREANAQLHEAELAILRYQCSNGRTCS